MHLLLRRPPYRQVREKVPEDGFRVLEIAASVLQVHLAPKDPELVQWNWKSWPKWHALAVVLAELCARPLGPEFDEFFPIAVEAFGKIAGEVADEQRKQGKANSNPKPGTSAPMPEIAECDAAWFTPSSLDSAAFLDQIGMSDGDLDAYFSTSWDSWESTVRDMYFSDYMDTYADNNSI
ncbi:hypothetical protein ACHAPQ_010253 [Fusarium lateritium]